MSDLKKTIIATCILFAVFLVGLKIQDWLISDVVPNAIIFDMPVKFENAITFKSPYEWNLVEGDSIRIPVSGDYEIKGGGDSVWIRLIKAK